MNELALFAGAGGGILGGKLLGWRTVCAVEWEPYPASVLCARQNDGLLPPFPIWDDVQTFDGRPWRGIVDVVSGGFPCQDISVAGKGAGIEGERSGMWKHMARVVGEVRPRFVFVENSPMLIHRGLARVLGDLATLGYDSRWTVMGAADVGAPHQRDRLWLVGHATAPRLSQRSGIALGRSKKNKESQRPSSQVAHSNVERRRSESQQSICSIGEKVCDESGRCGSIISNTDQARLQVGDWSAGSSGPLSSIEQCHWWHSEPDVGRVVNGVAARVDRLKAIGNGQVPLCAATAWRYLSELL
jgi:DNA (cytosine-5)-methyltransferase 1